MRIKIKLLLILLLVITLGELKNCWSRPIISGISSNQIDIDTNFTGAEVLLFGAKGDAGDIFVVVRGPRKNYLINQKGQLLGIWYNKKRLRFKGAYSYYYLFSSPNSDLPEDAELLSALEIGEGNIKFDIRSKPDILDVNNFRTQFVNILNQEQLYVDSYDKIEFLDETLFKVSLKFPKNISSGVYTAEIYLIDDNNLSAFQSIPIYVNQVGFSAEIRDMAYNNSFLYGILAILIAIISGWLANFIFSKFFGK